VGKKLEEILKQLGHATEDDIRWALQRMKRKLGEIVRDNRLITDHELHRSLVLHRYEPRRLR
jgi:DNA-binding transcriptional regulator PaaX